MALCCEGKTVARSPRRGRRSPGWVRDVARSRRAPADRAGRLRGAIHEKRAARKSVRVGRGAPLGWRQPSQGCRPEARHPGRPGRRLRAARPLRFVRPLPGRRRPARQPERARAVPGPGRRLHGPVGVWQPQLRAHPWPTGPAAPPDGRGRTWGGAAPGAVRRSDHGQLAVGARGDRSDTGPLRGLQLLPGVDR